MSDCRIIIRINIQPDNTLHKAGFFDILNKDDLVQY